MAKLTGGVLTGSVLQRTLFMLLLTAAVCPPVLADIGQDDSYQDRTVQDNGSLPEKTFPVESSLSPGSAMDAAKPEKPPADTSQVSASEGLDEEAIKLQEEKHKSVSFESLEQMNELIELGVPALALSLLEDEQAIRKTYSADWYSFEYKRIMLLSALEQWHDLIKRTEWLFATTTPGKTITAKIRLWFETQQVMARLQLKQSEQALDQLQRLLWQSDASLRDPSLTAVWRRLVIRAYLQMHNDDDARKALVRYQLDYDEADIGADWLFLQSQVLLRTGRPVQALALLQQVPSDEAKALALIARLQDKPDSAAQINTEMRELLEGQVLSRRARWAYAYVAFTASGILADLPAQILNLETMLSLTIEYPLFDDEYQVDADDLWELYSRLGLQVANSHGLLLGNDEQWLQSSKRLIKKSPEQALALNAALVLETENFETRKQQHEIIVEILEQRKDGLELINQLYLHSSKVKNVKVLPDEVRYRLVDYALSEGNYFEAATLMNSLTEPPPGDSLFDWRMRKARVLILQGGYDQSENIIRKTFAEKKSITHAELDRFIQVVFDFQTVQQHQQALDLFALVSYQGLEEKLKRELDFWKAESYFALKKYDRAALFYLSSARAVTDADNDLWGQSARFKAGNALVLAKIYDDAERIFKELLSVTASDSRKALIDQNLQKIKLLKSTLEQ